MFTDIKFKIVNSQCKLKLCFYPIVLCDKYQPILALALPIIREVFGHFMSSLGWRCAGKPVPSVELISGHIVALFHALFLSSCLGSIATPISGYILLGIDFVINLIFTVQIYYNKKGNIEKCGEALMTLVLNEFLETTVPLTFLLCFLVSFYGGNKDIIGMTVVSVVSNAGC